MKHINFIQSVSPHKKAALDRWFFILCSWIIALAASVAGLMFLEWNVYQKVHAQELVLQQQLLDFDTVMNTYRTTMQHIETSQTKLSKLEKYQSHTNQTLAAFEMVVQIVKQSSIQQLRIEKKKFSMQITCANPEHIMQISNAFGQNPLFKHVEVASIQTTQSNNLLVSFNGSLSNYQKDKISREQS